MNRNLEVHLCPILMRTVIFEDGKCTAPCSEEACPLVDVRDDESSISE